VLQYGGIVKQFIYKAVHGGIRWARKGTVEEVSMLDVNSLYPYALSELRPAVGAPLVWHEGLSLEDYPYSVIEVEFKEVSFPESLLVSMLAKCYRAGSRKVLDTITLADLKHYSTALSFTIIRGYVWRTVSEEAHQRIARFIEREYADKSAAVEEERKRGTKSEVPGGDLTQGKPSEAKRLKLRLNSLYGYILKRGARKLKRGGKGDWETQLNKNAPLIERVDPEEHAFWIRVAYDKSFNHTALGVQLLSETHHVLYGLIDRCQANGVPIYHIHTDSLLIPTSALPVFSDLMGPQLGGLKVEYSCAKADIVSSGRYTLTLTDGSVIERGRRVSR
jgi:hypothetical protein